MITACIGGVIRDITAGVPSILMRHELYVTTALLAAASFVLLTRVPVAAPWPVLLAFEGLLRSPRPTCRTTAPRHFAAWEQPQLLVDEMRVGLQSLR